MISASKAAVYPCRCALRRTVRWYVSWRTLEGKHARTRNDFPSPKQALRWMRDNVRAPEFVLPDLKPTR